MAVSMHPRKISAGSPMSLSGKSFDDEHPIVAAASDASTNFDDEPLMVALPDYSSVCAKAPKEFNDCLVFGDAPESSDEETRYSNTGLAKHLQTENKRLEEENNRLRMHYASCLQMASDRYSPWNAPCVYGMPTAFPSYAGAPGLCMPELGLGLQAQVQAQFGLHGHQGMPQMRSPGEQCQSWLPQQRDKRASVAPNVDAEAEADLEFDGDCSDISSGRDASQAALRSTVMLRNLPNSYTRQMLLNLLDTEGFAGKYDFVYFPIDFKSHLSLAYAFINLVSAKETKRFWQHFHGFSNWAVPSHKVARVNWSEFQGLATNIERYRSSPVMHEAVPDEYKPVLFMGTERIAFPAPTEKIRAPRRRVHAKAVQPGRLMR